MHLSVFPKRPNHYPVTIFYFFVPDQYCQKSVLSVFELFLFSCNDFLHILFLFPLTGFKFFSRKSRFFLGKMFETNLRFVFLQKSPSLQTLAVRPRFHDEFRDHGPLMAIFLVTLTKEIIFFSRPTSFYMFFG